MTTIGSLCTGYGGIEMGLAMAGVDVDMRWLSEIDDTLTPLLGGILNIGDMTTVDWGTVVPVDMITAGFPCQPVSAAGRQKADEDERWLWPYVREAAERLQPARVVLENVRNLVSIRNGQLWRGILDDLGALGYGVRWGIIGACHAGAAHHRHRVFAVATRRMEGVLHVDTPPCGTVLPLLPTPLARDGDGRGEGTPEWWAAGANGHRCDTLGAAVIAMLPTPVASDAVMGPSVTRSGPRRGTICQLAGLAKLFREPLFPTPTVANAHGNITNARGEPLLPGIAQLLPTPRASDGVNGGPNQRGRRGDLAMPSAVQPEHWGRYAEAVARHETLYGPAPAPTEPNRNGNPRLAPAFAEWLMCLPAGHITDKLARIPALRAIGNGVCPPQMAAAWTLLTQDQNTLW